MRHKSSQSTNLTFQCLFVTDPPIKFANLFHFSQSIANPMAIQTQSRTNPWSILCQSRSTHLQSSANLLANWTNPFPIHQFNPLPIWANPVPIICQSRSIQCQSTPDPASIWWPSGSIHCQSSSISVPILGQSNTNPVSILDNPPIKCQSWTYLPNSDPWPIRQFNAKSISNCLSIANPQIQ